MDNLSEFDIELAMRIKVLTPFTIAHASPEFIAYWLAITREAEQRKLIERPHCRQSKCEAKINRIGDSQCK
ncbi:TPA: hypothetical protein ACPJ1A_004369 [Vibrio diabolicus]